eukprot:1524723-Prymnesium_polylepis.1
MSLGCGYPVLLMRLHTLSSGEAALDGGRSTAARRPLDGRSRPREYASSRQFAIELSIHTLQLNRVVEGGCHGVHQVHFRLVATTERPRTEQWMAPKG